MSMTTGVLQAEFPAYARYMVGIEFSCLHNLSSKDIHKVVCSIKGMGATQVCNARNMHELAMFMLSFICRPITCSLLVMIARWEWHSG